jgi:2-polyprenyl-3-methyl-5-hydroxy-6-metoxy-1,4-benzoquinol methylase
MSTRLLHHPDADWERLGRDDPYYGVYVDRRFRSANLTRGALTEFFASGEQHVAALLATIERELVPGFAPKRALDFGCGVGRLLVPLARRCDEVVGVDIAESMVREAKRNLDERAIRNVVVLRCDDTLTAVPGSFDLIHSFVVLQHLSSRRGERILGRLIDRLAEHGLGAIHLTFSSELSRRSRLVRWARRFVPLVHPLWNWRHGLPLDEPWMQMNRYPLNRMFHLLQDRGCHRCAVRFTNHSGHRGVVLFFQKTGDAWFP